MPCTALGADDYEIGFVLGRDFWHLGFATELGTAQLQYGFDQLELGRLLAQVAPENERSIATLRKIGMRFHSEVVTEGRGVRHVYLVAGRRELG